MDKPELIFLSQTPVYDLGAGAGKQVIAKTIQGLSAHFNLSLVAPGDAPPDFTGRFYKLPEGLFNKLKNIPLLGAMYNYVHVAILASAVRQIVKRKNLKPDVAYLAGPWMSLIGWEIFGNNARIVNRYFGVNWKPEKHSGLKQRIKFHLRNKGYRKFGDLVIMTDDGTRGKEFLLQLGCPEERIRFWRNGLDFPSQLEEREHARQIIRRRFGIEKDARILLTVSRLAAWKKVDRAIRALAAMPNQNAQLVIVGEGEERAVLEALCTQLNVRDKVSFAGAVPHKELGHFYRAADIFVSLYDYSNAGNPLFEAMVQECAIVTLHSPELENFLSPDSALMLKSSNPEHIAAEVQNLLQRPEKVSEMGKNAAADALEHFKNWDQRIEMELQEIMRISR